MHTEKNHISVSVIIPVYNAGTFLAETIKSVLNQSFKEIELIIVNDGSTDDSALICEEFLQADDRIQLVNQVNSGVSIARNNGLLLAKGDYIYFMDSDDTLDEEFIKTTYETAIKGNDIVITGEYYCKRMPYVMALPTWAQMVRHDFLKKHPDIRFPEYIQPCEDGLFSHQLLALTTKIGLSPESIYHYRNHENQNHLKINENSWKVLHQIPTWFEILEEFYTRYDLFQSHALHLALFMEHEPFEFRYLEMPLDKDQKAYLHDLIKKFMSKNVLPYLKKKDYKVIGRPFMYFVNAADYEDFDTFYIQYLKNRAQQKKIYLFMTKFIPFKNLKRRLKKKIKEEF
jgi:glycosyltransferase involved in cell wall biosynthesis